MAKEENKAKVKMTVIHFETESDNETLQENIRSIANTIARALSTPKIVYGINPPTTNDANPGAIQSLPIEQVETTDDDRLVEESDNIEGASKPTTSKKKSSNRHLRTPRAIEIDLTSGELPLRAFIEQKKPDSIMKKYLCIIYWLKKHRNINEVNADHMYTCFRHMSWQVPADTAQPLRSMKGRQYGYMQSGSSSGMYTLNHIGENAIESM